MSKHLYSDRQRTALKELTQWVAERVRAEAAAEEAVQARTQAVEREFQDGQRRIQSLFAAETTAAQKEHQETTQATTRRFEQEHAALSREYAAVRQKAEELFDREKEKTEAEFKDAKWTIGAVYEAGKKVAKDGLVAVQRAVGTALQELETIRESAGRLLARWHLSELAEIEPTEPPPARDWLKAIQQCATTAGEQLELLNELRLPGYVKKSRYLPLSVLAWLVLTGPAFLLLQGGIDWWYYWAAGATVLVPLTAFGLHVWLRRKARREVTERYRPLRQVVADALAYQPKCLEQATARQYAQLVEAKEKRDEALATATRKYKGRVQDCTQRRDRDLGQAEEKYPPCLYDLVQRRDQELRQTEEKLQQTRDKATTRRDEHLAQATQRRDRLLEDSRRRHERDWQQLTLRWETGLASFLAVMQEVERDCGRLFPAWSDPVWQTWKPPETVPLGIRFGEIRAGLERIPDGVPRDPRLRKIEFPDRPLSALLGFPDHGSLLLKGCDEGRAVAVQTLQAVMLRYLTALPPGKVRFTIFDPVGLGENFAAFGHLADYVESLVTSRVWTETAHIEQRLADLTAHIENVIQQFLRNQFQSLREYNEQAGEVAEPYRVVVVANFPVNFSPEAARRLVSIASSGARCGIHTLISVDLKQPLPQGFQLADLEQAATTLVWRNGAFAWEDDDYRRFPLQLEKPATDEFTTDLLRVVGEKAKAAGRVEVPFDLLAPPLEKRWTADSRDGLRVPLGRAGAVKQQYLQLGQGTSQHVLIAGKTGSGKSTLLHALITQLALYYSPEEVELYLVDFKKGVEFKTYAVHALPHARVIAVESEREFGLSVLQRLDAELKRRGELFRGLGVNDLSSYRHEQPTTPMPRVLLVVDEFQEFFVEDDKIAQEAALLLDRLVRQGRAFGIHILLGSQTLGGAYSLARSTIDQMAVRIALQCSETDGHLILSKENGAARLLERPGEAIYNDANGRVEGNHLFQTVWLSDTQHEQALRDVRDLARERGYTPSRPQIVFEGTAPAELANNPLLAQLRERHSWPGARASWSPGSARPSPSRIRPPRCFAARAGPTCC